MTEKIEAIHLQLDEKLLKMTSLSLKNYQESKNKSDKLESLSTDLMSEVVKIQTVLEEGRVPLPEPVKPEFEVYGEVPYVPAIPKTGGLDEKKKKKKQIPKDDFKVDNHVSLTIPHYTTLNHTIIH